MAATTLAEGGDRRSSRQMWRQLYETSDDDWVRNNAQLKLQQLQALDEIDALAEMVARFGRLRGAPPRSWNELVAVRWLAGVPLDPAGTPYDLKPDAPGGVALSEKSSLQPLPRQFLKKAGPTR
jgi:hypothetical protein